MAMDIIEKDLDASGMRIGIVQARFNAWAGDALREACLAELLELGVHEDDITLVTVPGALEVPLALSALARSGDFDGLVALGCVIRGETYHFEVVAEQSAAGVARVSLEFDLPVANAILTTDTDEQAQARVKEKGAEAARVVVEMANLLSELAEDGEEDVGA